jgi:hypothetical protein
VMRRGQDRSTLTKFMRFQASGDSHSADLESMFA